MVPVDKRLFVIAEAGVNHNGRLDLALELVDVAAHSGADAVKFQTFRAASLVTPTAPKAKYQEKATGASQFEMLKSLELNEEAHRAVARRCVERKIEFMSTPFDLESIAMLDGLGVQRFKVPSGEVDNPVLLRAVARTRKPLIVSTGMSTLADVEVALGHIAQELVPEAGPQAAWTAVGQRKLHESVTVLHCTTEYPAPMEAVNLRAMVTMGNAFGVPFGYSDHTHGAAISCAAVALGASVVEKHFTTDRKLPGPDHAASLEPEELAEFVRMLRDVERGLGTGRKVPAAVEVPNRMIARRSVVAAMPIACGEPLTEQNLALKRPGSGIPASRFYEMVGRVALRDYLPDEPIDP
jgi:N-acetylneuraminate synthase